MPCQPSEATLLRAARKHLKIETQRAIMAEKQRNEYRSKLADTQKELAEWKERFDILLRTKAGADSEGAK